MFGKQELKRKIHESKTGAEFAQRMLEYFKSYTIPEMSPIKILSPTEQNYQDLIATFDGNVPLP